MTGHSGVDEGPQAVRASLERMWKRGDGVGEDAPAPRIWVQLSPPEGTPRAHLFHTGVGFSTESGPFSTHLGTSRHACDVMAGSVATSRPPVSRRRSAREPRRYRGASRR